MYQKIYKCQPSAKRYGLNDLTLNFDKDINFPYYGLTFASKKDLGNGVFEYTSLWKEDNKCADFQNTLAHKLLTDPRVKFGKQEYSEINADGVEIKYENYALLYYNPDSSIFKPSILTPIDTRKPMTYKIVYEFLFAFPDGWIFPVEHIVETDEVLKWNNINYWKDYFSDIEEDISTFFYESPACHFENLGTDSEKIELEVSNLSGDYTTLTYDKYSKQEIADCLSSVRIIEIKKRKDQGEWEDVTTTLPFTEPK